MKKRMRVLIGYDGSAGAVAAVEDLKKAGLPEEQTEALVICAADVFLPSGRGAPVPEPVKTSIRSARAAARRQLKRAGRVAKEAARKIKLLFPAWNVNHAAFADSPAWALVKRAERWKPHLIVLGPSGHSKIGRFLGSVSQMVLNQAPCSVRLGRGPVHPTGERIRVLIGVDGSRGAAEAVRAVAARTWPFDSDFRLIFVAAAKKSRAAALRTLESFAKQLRKRDATVTCDVRKGDPKRALAKEAAAWEADCLFVGARRLTHIKRFFIGGVSTSVAAQAPCSVEVIRKRPR